MAMIMIVLGLALLAFAYFQIRGGAVQKEIAPFIPALAADNASPDAIATFRGKTDAIFTRHRVTDPKRRQALTNYARIIAKRNLTPEQNELLVDLLKQKRI